MTSFISEEQVGRAPLIYNALRLNMRLAKYAGQLEAEKYV